MKNIYTIKFIVFTAFFVFLLGCNIDDIDKTNEDETNVETILSGHIDTSISDDPNYLSGCYVTTILSETELGGNQFEINTTINECVQTFFVRDNWDNVYLMSRTPTSTNTNLEINIQSTTTALVTMHPLFSPVKSDEYQKVIDLIFASSQYQNLYNEVEKTIKAKRHIFDESNVELLLAFSNLIEDICGEVEEDIYSDSLEVITNPSYFRAVYKNTKIYPLHAEINGNVLTLRNTGLTPSYYGTVKRPDGNVDNISVLSRSDYGGLDIFIPLQEINLGPERIYPFITEGNHRFYLSRTNSAATADFFLRIANSLLASIGLSLGNDAIQDIGNMISKAIINANSGVNDPVIDPNEWIGIAYNAMLTQLETGTFFSHGVPEAFVNISKAAASALDWYSKIKGVGNAITRLGYALSAPEELNFCLCYNIVENKEVVSTCTVASLEKIEGDGQTGYTNQRLLLPLTVEVKTIIDDSVTNSGSTNRIKFEVVSGGGKLLDELVSADHNNHASTYWTLGESNEQKVKVTVVDNITDREISEPVYFTASLERAEVTIRLDWSKHSGDTDIDLHVVDPFGEEIAYYNMISSSGGYLDRDDVVGPGPEHIHWENAPVGTYKIYVHYYPNEEEDRSVTSFKVSVTADGITYYPVRGSIGYDQFIPIGQFTVGGSTIRSITSISLDDTGSIGKKAYPKK